MTKTIEIRLSDDQHAALAAEANASGKKFYDWCRVKVLVGLQPMLPEREAAIRKIRIPEPVAESWTPPAKATPTTVDDRMDRLESMMMEMGRAIVNLANPVHVVEPRVPAEQAEVDAIVGGALNAAEQAGLTVVEREAFEPQTGEVRHVGTRPPAPFTVVPRHLQGQF